jgi:3-methyladenine DNA glycosylase AlkD
MLAWASDADLWKRRTAIISQVRFQAASDVELLHACIAPSIGSRELFLRKAIGWALRRHARIDPEGVARYVRAHPELSPSSRREALKHVGA